LDELSAYDGGSTVEPSPRKLWMTRTLRRLSNVAGYGKPTADSGQLKRDGLPTTNRLSAVTT